MCSIERGVWRCSVIIESAGVADSEMMEILPVSAKYFEKARWYLYTKQDPGFGTKHCW